ncbi:MAG: toprim domain-containing protein [Candidatus Marinimicrobia bacterium]|nr:toprim domain-containing protein [Candidatus Neomarinimicrobiota bacterium]
MPGDRARLLRRFADEAVLCYDSDEAGQKAAVRTAFTLASQKLDCRILKLPEGEDPDSYLQNEGADAFFKREANALPMMEFLREYYQPSSMSPGIRRKRSPTFSMRSELSTTPSTAKPLHGRSQPYSPSKKARSCNS